MSLADRVVVAATVDCGIAVWEYDFAQNAMTRTANHDALYGIAPQERWVMETFLNATHPEDRHLANQHIARCVVKGGADDYRFDFRVVWPDQSVHWLRCAGHVARRDDAGAAVIVHGVIHDVTAEKDAEVALRAAVRQRDELMQLASHELNTPLHALQLKAEQLRRGGLGGADADFLERHIKKLEMLVKDLLVAGRIGNDTLQLTRRDLALADVVRGVVDDFAGLARRAGCDVSFDVKADGRGSFDQVRLEQLVANLLMNAFKYGAGKPVKVVVDGTSFCVEDGGVGIEEGALGTIFEKFTRAPSAGRFGGLGLGLYVAKGIVDAHGGRIAVDSRVGAGTRFTVHL